MFTSHAVDANPFAAFRTSTDFRAGGLDASLSRARAAGAMRTGERFLPGRRQ
jgi:hypothetical protein